MIFKIKEIQKKIGWILNAGGFDSIPYRNLVRTLITKTYFQKNKIIKDKHLRVVCFFIKSLGNYISTK